MGGEEVEMQSYTPGEDADAVLVVDVDADAVAADVVLMVNADAVAADAVPVVAAVDVDAVLIVDENFVLNSLTEMPDDYHQLQRSQPCTIYKVLEGMRSEDPRAYDPQLVSIGPYHHNNKLLLPMERIKRQFLRHLVGRDPANTLPKYINALSSAASVAKASKYYSEYFLGSDGANNFVKMMVLDGCFIIEFLVRSLLGEDMGELDFVNWNRSLVENDLLRLENQVPFSVLESLFCSSVIPRLSYNDGQPLTLKELAYSFVSREIKYNVPPIPEDVYHLLHLRHSLLAPPANNTQEVASKSCYCMWVMRMTINKITDVLLHSFFLLLSVLLRCCRPPPSPPEPEPEPSQRAPRSIPSATELHESGIKFHEKKKCCMLDVSFSKRDGIMEIPLVSIQAVTVSQFRNLVAFEQCCPGVGNRFTSYVALMDNLIDKPEDVALLEYSGVLESKLGDDEEVCQVFNKLGKGAYLEYEKHNMKDLFKDVKDYYRMKKHWWRAMVVRKYFSNPWSAISLFAAAVLLLLAALQTFFAVYAYFRPPPGSK